MNIYSFTIYQKMSLLREIYFATKAISLLTIGFFYGVRFGELSAALTPKSL